MHLQDELIWRVGKSVEAEYGPVDSGTLLGAADIGSSCRPSSTQTRSSQGRFLRTPPSGQAQKRLKAVVTGEAQISSKSPLPPVSPME